MLQEEVDERLEDDDMLCISIKPSVSLNDRVVKVKSVEIETDELYECNVQTNTEYEQVTMETQTDFRENYPDNDKEIDQEYLGNWLESIYPRISNILEMNASSKAFDLYEWKDSSLLQANTLQYTLTTNFVFSPSGLEDEDEEAVDDSGSFQEYQDDIDEWGDMQSLGKRTKASATKSSNASVKSQKTVVEETKTRVLSHDVSSISWNCNGSTLAVSYGNISSQTVPFQGWVSIWGIFRRDLDTKKPSKNIETTNCITSVKFHPSDPSILAGGSFIGEIYIWNVFSENHEICSSRADEYYHREVITQLLWIQQQQFGSLKYIYNLISASTDGKILVWSPENKLSHPKRGYIIARKKKADIVILGATCIDVNLSDINTFILGTEEGAIFKLSIPMTSFSGQFDATGDFESLQKKLRWKKDAVDFMNTINNKIGLEKLKQDVERYWMDRGHKEVDPVHIFNSKPDLRIIYSIPITMNFERQEGPNTGISCSPFQPKLFLSWSIDGTIKMYNQNSTIALFEPCAEEYIMDVWFSPIRPTVFAAIGLKGYPYIYDLSVSEKVPAFVLEETEESKLIKNKGGIKISFNPKQRDFLAVGFIDGETKIYRLNISLSNPKKNEINILNDFVKSRLGDV